MSDSLQSGNLSLPELEIPGREKNEDYNDSVPVYLPDSSLRVPVGQAIKDKEELTGDWDMI